MYLQKSMRWKRFYSDIFLFFGSDKNKTRSKKENNEGQFFLFLPPFILCVLSVVLVVSVVSQNKGKMGFILRMLSMVELKKSHTHVNSGLLICPRPGSAPEETT